MTDTNINTVNVADARDYYFYQYIDPQLLSSLNNIYSIVARQHSLFTKVLPKYIEIINIDYYLLFRIIDIIEDSHFSYNIQIQMLQNISDNFISGLNYSITILNQNLSNIESKYIKLIKYFPDLLKLHYSLPIQIQNNIQNTGQIMAKGMAKYLVKYYNSIQDINTAFIDSIDDLDNYCYFVAGCVGELNTKIFLYYNFFNKNNSYDILIQNSKYFGNYIQGVNIIRDICEDYLVSKNYIPNSLSNLPLHSSINQIITFYNKNINKIIFYNNQIQNRCVLKYCNLLYKFASIHYKFYKNFFSNNNITSLNCQKKFNNNYNIKIPFYLIILNLPFKLKLYFLQYKLKKFLSLLCFMWNKINIPLKTDLNRKTRS